MSSIFSQNFIRPHSFADVTAGGRVLGYSFDMFLPDSRGSHLSGLQNFTVLEDGVPVSPEQLIFVLHGKEFMVSHFPMLAYEYWRIDEDARLNVLNGKSCRQVGRVEVKMDLRVPFAGTWEEPVVTPMRAWACPGPREEGA